MQTNAHAPTPLESSTLSAGEILKGRRESLDLSIADVARILRIRRDYIESIEQNAIHLLPELPYTLGFVRSYAHFLQVEPQKLVEQFKALLPDNDNQQHLASLEIQTEESTPSRGWLIGSSLATLILVVGWFLWPRTPEKIPETFTPLPLATQQEALSPLIFMRNQSAIAAERATAHSLRRAEEQLASNSLSAAYREHYFLPISLQSIIPSGSDISAPRPLETSYSPAKEDKPSLPPLLLSSSASTDIKLTAHDYCWPKVRDAASNTVVFEKTLAPGETYSPPTHLESIIISVSNAGALEVQAGNMQAQQLGQPKEVKRNIILQRSRTKHLGSASSD